MNSFWRFLIRLQSWILGHKKENITGGKGQVKRKLNRYVHKSSISNKRSARLVFRFLFAQTPLESFTDLFRKEVLYTLIMSWYTNWLQEVLFKVKYLYFNLYRYHSSIPYCRTDTLSNILAYVLKRLHLFLRSFPASKQFIIWKQQKLNSITCFP